MFFFIAAKVPAKVAVIRRLEGDGVPSAKMASLGTSRKLV